MWFKFNNHIKTYFSWMMTYTYLLWYYYLTLICAAVWSKVSFTSSNVSSFFCKGCSLFFSSSWNEWILIIHMSFQYPKSKNKNDGKLFDWLFLLLLLFYVLTVMLTWFSYTLFSLYGVLKSLRFYQIPFLWKSLESLTLKSWKQTLVLGLLVRL